MRRNSISDCSTAYYGELYRADLFTGIAVKDIQVTTKLMVLPEFSGTMAPIKMIQKYASDGYDAGVRVDLMDCNAHLIRFFERFGYCSYLGWVAHEEYGRVRPMFLAVDAVEHMKRLHSPLFAIAMSKLRDGEYGGYRWIQTLAESPEGLSTSQFLENA
jgi:hypothetical protein